MGFPKEHDLVSVCPVEILGLACEMLTLGIGSVVSEEENLAEAFLNEWDGFILGDGGHEGHAIPVVQCTIRDQVPSPAVFAHTHVQGPDGISMAPNLPAKAAALAVVQRDHLSDGCVEKGLVCDFVELPPRRRHPCGSSFARKEIGEPHPACSQFPHGEEVLPQNVVVADTVHEVLTRHAEE